MPEIIAYLKSVGWLRHVNDAGEVSYLIPDSELAIEINATGWELLEFTDGDIHGVATGRYRHVDDGETLEELQAAIATMAGPEVA